MVIFQGEVNSNEKCINMGTSNGTLCIALCIRNESCLLALMTNEDCFHCNYGKVSSVTRSGDSSKYIALKMDYRFPSLLKETDWWLLDIPQYFTRDGSCPSGTFHLKTCKDGWEMFRRDSIWYCLKVVYNQNPMNQSAAKLKCSNEQYGAKLSGLENMNETRFVAENVEREMISTDSASKRWDIWIDGERRPLCTSSSNVNKISDCKGINGFEFSDNTLKKHGGYDWSEGEPNGRGDIQNCVVMMITTEVNTKNGKKNGKLDDIQCDALKRGVLCGMEAQ
ncbi:hypothetical protein CRE_06573 [Caenorhabditis remanei]|uniref:Uncharacterized protein n=1 Tax=Caenorhabditis remanei TaxID=31234 RepID=E3M1L7_CAERE|nr:hypothetical protein CRE_06573 [Caenorhabditis remanei]